MDMIIAQKVIISVAVCLCVLVISHFCKKQAKNIQQKRHMQRARYFAIRRFLSLVSFVLIIISLILIWGVNIKNLWVSIAGVLAMVAVAFFAVWSLVGNILAGFILFFTNPFKINDTIEIMPDGIKGKVLAINTFFSLVCDDDGNYINVPNSLFFQKYIKKIKK